MIRVSRPRLLVRRGVLVTSASLLGACSCWGGGDDDIDCSISFGPQSVSGQVFVHNASSAPAVLSVSSVTWVGCQESERFDDGFLRSSDFTHLTTLQMDPDEIRALALPCECPRVQIEAFGRNFGVRWWSDLPFVDLGTEPGSEDLPQVASQLITFENEERGPTLTLGEELEGFEVSSNTSPLSGDGCFEASIESMGYTVRQGVAGVTTTLDRRQRGLALSGLVTSDDGCFDVELVGSTPPADSGGGEEGGGGAAGQLGSAGAAGAPPLDDAGSSTETYVVGLCVPPAMFPFVSGDVVDLKAGDAGLDLASSDGPGHFRMQLGSLNYDEWSEYSVGERTPPCGPVRDLTGAVWEPVEVRVGDQVLVPGAIQEVQSKLGVNVYLGRATKGWRSTLTCDVERPVRVEIVERTLR